MKVWWNSLGWYRLSIACDALALFILIPSVFPIAQSVTPFNTYFAFGLGFIALGGAIRGYRDCVRQNKQQGECLPAFILLVFAFFMIGSFLPIPAIIVTILRLSSFVLLFVLFFATLYIIYGRKK